MAELMKVDVVSPERMVASVEAEAVMLPGTDGDFTAMAGHVPVATGLRPGMVTVRAGNVDTEFLITGGFAEVSDAGVSVLAERVAPKAEATAEMFSQSLAAAEEAIAIASEDNLAEAQRALGGLKALIASLP